MKKLIFDTSVVLDLLKDTRKQGEAAARLLTLAEAGQIKIYLSAYTVMEVYQSLSEELSKASARNALNVLLGIVAVVPLDEKQISLALGSDRGNISDNLVYHASLGSQAAAIITNHTNTFRYSFIPAFTPVEYLASLSGS